MAILYPFPFGVDFRSHESHNPEYDILEGQLDEDTYITYCLCIKGPNKGQESCEYYSGENYVSDSTKRSYSRHWKADEIPVKYKQRWQLLRSMYKEMPFKKE